MQKITPTTEQAVSLLEYVVDNEFYDDSPFLALIQSEYNKPLYRGAWLETSILESGNTIEGSSCGSHWSSSMEVANEFIENPGANTEAYIENYSDSLACDADSAWDFFTGVLMILPESKNVLPTCDILRSATANPDFMDAATGLLGKESLDAIISEEEYTLWSDFIIETVTQICINGKNQVCVLVSQK